ncbi:methyltransferase domain-containing protein [Rubrobacter taiwanensis]|uniref:Methyltransferase domain-containing protein n=1 Tax=Rubrobacter taiwanensis TaxID=185139 RepID=A0A4R1BLM6_9ACTN|nr:methyltransferase domain-containing protein [Rubrobacter taiwanensis]TCJ18341.1 methyltransferase domain-containing protein [Rubrobacter taiwanensis]
MLPERLRAHLSGRTDLKETTLRIGDREYRLMHPAAPYALIDEEEFARDERLPYWAELWPSAVALARQLEELGPCLSGRRVIELGCGVGLPAIVALAHGARVLATDHYASALDFARHNAERNTGYALQTALLDWRAPEPVGKFGLVMAADVLYERRNVGPLLALISELLESGGEVLIADPQRASAPLFAQEMRRQGFRHSSGMAEVELDGPVVRVELHRFVRQGRHTTRA